MRAADTRVFAAFALLGTPGREKVARYSYIVSLRIEHPSMDPDDLTSRLGREPKRAWRAGSPRTTSRGRPLQGTNATSFWVVTLVDGEWPKTPIATALAEVVKDLESHAGVLHQVRAEGGRAELFVGWFFDEGNSGDELPASLLSDLGRLGLDLSFDVYPADAPPPS